MFAPPICAAIPVFADEDSKTHASTTLAFLTLFAQAQHAIPQFVAHDRSWRRRTPIRRGDFNAAWSKPDALSGGWSARPDQQETGSKNSVNWFHDPSLPNRWPLQGRAGQARRNYDERWNS